MPNSRLLRKVAKAIEEKPERYDQSVWLLEPTPDEYGDTLNTKSEVERIRKGLFSCGAVGCIAGHAVVLGPDSVWHKVLQTAMNDCEVIDWFAAGQQALEIDEAVAGFLFDSIRRPDAMPMLLRTVADGEDDIETLWDLEQAY